MALTTFLPIIIINNKFSYKCLRQSELVNKTIYALTKIPNSANKGYSGMASDITITIIEKMRMAKASKNLLNIIKFYDILQGPIMRVEQFSISEVKFRID